MGTAAAHCTVSRVHVGIGGVEKRFCVGGANCSAVAVRRLTVTVTVAVTVIVTVIVAVAVGWAGQRVSRR